MLQLLDNLPEPIFAIGEDLGVRYCNETFANMIGVSKRVIREGHNIFSYVDLGEKFLEKVDFTMQEFEASQSSEITFVTKEGQELTCQVSGQVLFSNGEKVFLVFLKDMSLEISLHKKYRREMAEKEEFIKHLDRKLFETSFLFEISSLFSSNQTEESILVQILKKSVNTLCFSRAFFISNSDLKNTERFQLEAQVKNEVLGYTPMNENETLRTLTKLIESTDCDIEPTVVSSGQQRYVLITIIGKNSKLGTLIFESEEQRKISAEDCHLIKVMSQQLAMILDNEHLYYNSITDEKTKLYNVRYFLMALRKEIQRSIKSRALFALVIIDIDHFKKFNDSYGHNVGDVVLKHVAKTIKSAIRASDIAARYGGEEFAVMLVDTNIEGITIAAERIRTAVEAASVATDDFGPLKVTVSVGVALCPDQGMAETELIESADRALYHAKKMGRNNVQFYNPLKMVSGS